MSCNLQCTQIIICPKYFEDKKRKYSLLIRKPEKDAPCTGLRPPSPVGGGGTQIWNWYICAAQGLKMGVLGSGPSLKIWGFESGHLRVKTGDFGTKNNKETVHSFKTRVFSICPGRKRGTKNCILLKRESFWSGPDRKSRVFRSGQGQKWGAFAQHIAVLSLYGSTPPPPPPPPGLRPTVTASITELKRFKRSNCGICRGPLADSSRFRFPSYA